MSLKAEPTANRAGANHGPSRARKALTRLCGTGIGVAGAAAAIGAAGAGVAQAKPPVLKQGSQGTEVSKVQQALGVGSTGYYGPVTQNRVAQYQRDHGLKSDGVVGGATESALFGSGGSQSTGSKGSSAKSQGSTSTPKRASSSSSGYSASSGSGSGSSVPSRLKQCESGGNYHAVNPSTGAGGAYQIMPSTWRANGGTGSPQTASPQEQDRVASKIYSSSGGSQWTCK